MSTSSPSRPTDEDSARNAPAHGRRRPNPLRLGEVGQGPRQRPEVGDLGLGVGALLDEQPRELFATQREPVEVVRRHRCEVGRGVDDVLTCDEVGHADWEDVVAVPEIGHHGAWELSCNG
jgi:hypothetical protein